MSERRGQKKNVLFIVVLVAILSIAFAFAFRGWTNTPAFKKYDPSAPIVGHLGGVPVRIPPQYVFLLSYDDTGRKSREKNVDGEPRSFKSPISGFNFTLPLFAISGRSAPDTSQALQSRTFTVAVNSNANFGNADQLLRLAESAGKRLDRKFERVPELAYGLERYTASGAVKNRSVIDSMSVLHQLDVYLHRSAEGDVDVYIECLSGEAAYSTCWMRFLLLPEIKAAVSIRFPEPMLPQWRVLDNYAKNLILGFREAPIYYDE
jgi:hypothetical protein